MTVRIASRDKFLGIPLLLVRNVLRAWHSGKSRDPFDIAKLKSVGLNPSTVMVLIEELRDRGLIGEQKDATGFVICADGLTEAGLALAGAVGQRSIGRDAALRVVSQLLDRCELANADQKHEFTVDAVWLFGSILGEADKLSDVDIAVDIEFHGEIAGFADHLAKRRTFDRSIFGNRRHPALSATDSAELIALGCPCKLVFDRRRGGRVSDTALPLHPRSQGRRNDLAPKPEMPGLFPRTDAPRPISACFNDTQTVSIGSWMPDRQPLFERNWTTRLVTDDRPLPDHV